MVQTAKMVMKIILMCLPYLLDWLDSYLKKRARQAREEQRDALRKNPGAWAANHFDGKLHQLDASGKMPRADSSTQAKD